MSYNDKPTDNQLDVIYRWFSWIMPTERARNSIKWLGEHSNRKEVSSEMSRLKRLKDKRNLDQENCFDSAIWKGFLGGGS